MLLVVRLESGNPKCATSCSEFLVVTGSWKMYQIRCDDNCDGRMGNFRAARKSGLRRRVSAKSGHAVAAPNDKSGADQGCARGGILRRPKILSATRDARDGRARNAFDERARYAGMA